MEYCKLDVISIRKRCPIGRKAKQETKKNLVVIGIPFFVSTPHDRQFIKAGKATLRRRSSSFTIISTNGSFSNLSLGRSYLLSYNPLKQPQRMRAFLCVLRGCASWLAKFTAGAGSIRSSDFYPDGGHYKNMHKDYRMMCTTRMCRLHRK